MNATIKLLAIAALFFIGFGSALSANHLITVGGSGLVFSPKNLTINAGDTVTFNNAGGFHNVVSDPDAVTGFRCATDCAGNADPSSAAWSATLTFPTAGKVGYFCEVHGAPGQGMFGSITVNAVAPPPFTIGGYISGNWYTAGQGGHGFQIEAATNNNMVAIWFVYAPDGSGQNWIYAQGNYSTTTNTVTLPAILLTGAAFPPNFNSSDLTQTSWGTITFTFNDCNTGTVSWNSTLPGYGTSSLPITRLTQIDGTSCPQ